MDFNLGFMSPLFWGYRVDEDYDEVVVICWDITLFKKTHRRSKDWKLGPLSGSFMHVESGKLWVMTNVPWQTRKFLCLLVGATNFRV